MAPIFYPSPKGAFVHHPWRTLLVGPLKPLELVNKPVDPLSCSSVLGLCNTH